jgi:hypothetical protein
MNPNTFEFNVGDLIETDGFTSERIYHISSILWGATHQENLIELVALDLSDPYNVENKKTNALVPLEMLCAGIDAGIVKHTKKTNLDK